MGARAARAPPATCSSGCATTSRATPTPSSRRCCARGRCSRSPRASSSRRSALGGWELPAGVHVAPCIYLTHRRPELYPRPDRVPPRALPRRRRARRLRVDPVRRRHPPLRRRRVRRDGDDRGAARGRRARDAATRPPGRRADAAAVAHADARSAGRAWSPSRYVQADSRVPLFCRHNRLTQNCPICSRELAAERRPSTPARPRSRSGSRSAQRAAPRPRRRHAPRRARRRRRLPQPARPGPARDRRRRAPGRRARLGRRAARAARPASRGRRGAGRARRRSGSRSCSRSSPPGAHELHAAIVASRPSWASGEAARDARRRPAHRARLPRLGGALRLAGRGLPRRARLVARAALRPRVRAPRAARASVAARATSCC